MLQNGPVILAFISARSSLPDPPVFLAVYALVSELMFSNLSCLGVLADFVSCFPVSKGFQRSQRDCSALARDVLGVFYLPPCLSFCYKEGLHSLFSLLPDGITLVAIFPINPVEEYKIK